MKDENQKHQVAARRQQILEAAARVFAQKGFHPTTTKDIAREAGIAEGTIYNYFDTKAALLIGIFDLMTTAVRQNEDLTKITPDDLRGFLRLYFAQPLMALKENNFELFRVVVSEMMVNPELHTLFNQQILEPMLALGESLFQGWIARGLIAQVNSQLLTRTISGSILGLIIENVMGDQTLQDGWDALPDFLADLILVGIKRPQP